MTVPLNAAVMTVSGAPGTGTITLGAALAPYRTWAAAGAVNGGSYSYRIDDGGNFEIGYGTYTATGTTLTRTLVYSSTGSLLSLSSAAIVSAVALDRDLNQPGNLTVVASSYGGSQGFHYYSDGSLLQWGQSTVSNTVVTFPTAFANACRAAVGTVQYYDAANVFVVSIDAPSKTSVGMHSAYYGAGAGYQAFGGVVHWLAQGF